MSNIAICHYRVGLTDGVSLEIAKRKRMLTEMGHKVILIGGTNSIGADYIIPELEFDSPSIQIVKKNAFNDLIDFISETELMQYISKVAQSVEKQFLGIQMKEQFEYIFVHNIFSHGRNIAIAKAFYTISLSSVAKVISVDHDFYTSYGDMYKSNLKSINEYLDKFVPPKDNNIKHITINSISQNQLKSKTGLKSIIFPDTFDFEQPSWNKDDFNKDFLTSFKIKNSDLVILQATRIVERKGIEIAIDVACQIKQNIHKLRGNVLYNGKRLNKNSDVILLLPGIVEQASKDYFSRIKVYGEKKGVTMKFISKQIATNRSIVKSNEKTYSLWDYYVFADVVTYPSTWEGWGNQFIEAIFAKKPVILFEYPVFLADIKTEGYKYISLGCKYNNIDSLKSIPHIALTKATQEVFKWMLSSNTPKILETNFKIGSQFHGNNVLRHLLQTCLAS